MKQLKWLLFAAVLIVAIWSLGKQFKHVDWHSVTIRPLPIAGAFVCLLLVPPVQLLSYRGLLQAYAHAPPLREMAVVAWIPPLGKYAPGASWVSAFVILRRFGISVPVGLSVIVAMDGLAVISGLIVGSPVVGSMLPGGEILTGIAVVCGLACLHPAVFGRLLNIALKKLGRQPLATLPKSSQFLVPLACAFSQWLLAGVAFWLVAGSVATVSPKHILRFIEVAALGYTIGYLVLFAPAGLGPRDVIFAKLTTGLIFPAAMSAVATVIVRIVQTITELTAGLAGLAILRSIERQSDRR